MEKEDSYFEEHKEEMRVTYVKLINNAIDSGKFMFSIVYQDDEDAKYVYKNASNNMSIVELLGFSKLSMIGLEVEHVQHRFGNMLDDVVQ